MIRSLAALLLLAAVSVPAALAGDLTSRTAEELIYIPRTRPSFFFTAGPLQGGAGENSRHICREEEDFALISRIAGIGYDSLLQANPGIDPWIPGEGTELIIPDFHLLPPGISPGITVNLAEYLLYLVEADGNGYRIRFYPVGIGQEDSPTPNGDMHVNKKIPRPKWVVPPSVRKEHPEYPAVIPPGPDNALGEYWIGLSSRGFGIHGTNKAFGVGTRVSHGCVRLYPEDIKDLFHRVAVNTRVSIIYEPVKVALINDNLFVELHPDFLGELTDPVFTIMKLAGRLGYAGPIDWPPLLKEIANPSGVPRKISLQ